MSELCVWRDFPVSQTGTPPCTALPLCHYKKKAEHLDFPLPLWRSHSDSSDKDSCTSRTIPGWFWTDLPSTVWTHPSKD